MLAGVEYRHNLKTYTVEPVQYCVTVFHPNNTIVYSNIDLNPCILTVT